MTATLDRQGGQGCDLDIVQESPDKVWDHGQDHEVQQAGIMPLCHGLGGLLVVLPHMHIWMPPLCPRYTCWEPMQEQ